ncbi:thiamine pyrophosphate-binding protein [Zeaxanthinibacter sp. PT1]|uniref:2-succinyl-5-enolpyruvyl-6-hydroxy-3- cyclohexene-1-carboxylate synthase n=1 Tax=Zeaxanthinibacter TaxID=561554 RepID=UPI00234A4987|nr:thiamine pyrophosphate-binding protein [Zeaxanthinibacter sp. PT1]MDC6351682.1 thiamine pyrophosphate-binding protein [Zeaxanthinibacter sp. PT1]
MKYSSIPLAQTIVLYCKAWGIKNIVISPGSRNAPLTIGFTEDPFFNCFSIVDERSAAFFAMGLTQEKKEGVVILCTSGSALLNYYPAVAEAFYSDIPMLVISADRPAYKIDIGDGQTIRQPKVLEAHVNYSANLKQDVIHATATITQLQPAMITGDEMERQQEEIQQFNENRIQEAFRIALTEKAPVHLNCPFEEPLYQTQQSPSVPQPAGTFTVQRPGVQEVLEGYAATWNRSAKKMVLVGSLPAGAIPQLLLDQLANDPSVIVLTETTSNLSHNAFFPSIDSIVAPIEKSENKQELFEKLRPEILLTFGGMIVSKKIKAFLREYRPLSHWHLDPKKAYDTFFCLDHHFRQHPADFLCSFLPRTTEVPSDYQPYWTSVKEQYRERRSVYLEQIPFSDFKAFSSVVEYIPENTRLQLANSSTIRYSQLFDLHPSVRVYCNRGTSGIEGSTSTAVGAAYKADGPALLITGDLSFLYDTNGLWNNYLRDDFRIIVINNGGGGIFRILPGAEETENFQTYFETTQDLNLEHSCKMYGLQHDRAMNESELDSLLQDFFKPSDQPRLLEICTPRTINNKILLKYFDFIS